MKGPCWLCNTQMASCNLANYFTSFFFTSTTCHFGRRQCRNLNINPDSLWPINRLHSTTQQGEKNMASHSTQQWLVQRPGKREYSQHRPERCPQHKHPKPKKKCKYNNTPRVTVVDSDQLRSSWPASTLRCSCQNLKINKLKEQAEGARWLQTQTALPCSNRLGPLRQPRLGQLVLASWSCHARLAILVLRGVQAERPCPRHWPETESCTCRPAADPSQTIRLVRPILVSLVLGLKFSLGTKF